MVEICSNIILYYISIKKTNLYCFNFLQFPYQFIYKMHPFTFILCIKMNISLVRSGFCGILYKI